MWIGICFVSTDNDFRNNYTSIDLSAITYFFSLFILFLISKFVSRDNNEKKINSSYVYGS